MTGFTLDGLNQLMVAWNRTHEREHQPTVMLLGKREVEDITSIWSSNGPLLDAKALKRGEPVEIFSLRVYPVDLPSHFELLSS